MNKNSTSGSKHKFSTKNIILIVLVILSGRFINELITNTLMLYGYDLVTASFISLTLAIIFLVSVLSLYFIIKKILFNKRSVMFKKLLQILLIFFIIILIITGLVILFKSITDPMYCLPFSENGICGDGKY